MPYALIFFGLLFTVAGVRNTEKDLYALFEGDLTGQNSFLVWLAALGIIGAVGYVKPLQPVSVAFLTLVLVVIFLHNNSSGKNVLQEFVSALQNVQTGATTSAATPSTTTSPQASSSDASSLLPSLPSLVSSAIGGF